jgi:opacity protein-like surface antigen
LRAGIEAALAAALLALPAPARAQGLLEQFSYDGLRLTAVGFEVGGIVSDRVTSEATGALRFHLGYFAPKVRLMVGASYFKGFFNADQIAQFEARVRGLVNDPTNDATVDVGTISLADVTAGVDLQYVVAPGGRVRPYGGLGIGVHFRDGDGAAISGTFVEDALDTIAAGATASLGLEVAITSALLFTVDVRGELTSEIRTAAVRAGMALFIPAL